MSVQREPELSQPSRRWATSDTLGDTISKPKSGSLLKDLVDVIIRRKWIVAFVTILTSAGVIGGTMFLPEPFSAGSTLLVKFGREFRNQATVGSNPHPRTYTLTEMVNSMVEVLRTGDLAQEVLTEIGHEQMYPLMFEDPDTNVAKAKVKAIGKYQNKLRVYAILDSSIIKVSFEHEDPTLVAKVVNLHVDRFLDKHVQIFSGSPASFLKEQRDKYRADLDEAADALKTFTQEHGVFDSVKQQDRLLMHRMDLDTARKGLDATLAELEVKLSLLPPAPDHINGDGAPDHTSRESLIGQLQGLQSERKTIEFTISETAQRLKSFRGLSEGADLTKPVVPGVEGYGSIDTAKSRLLDLQLLEKELLRDYSESGRQVKSVRQRIKAVEDWIAEYNRFLNKFVGGAKETELVIQLDAAQAREKKINELIKGIEDRITYLAVREVRDEIDLTKARRDILIGQIDEIDRESLEIDRRSMELVELQRVHGAATLKYNEYHTKFEDATANEALDRRRMINIHVVEEATQPVTPQKIPFKLKIVIGAMAGVLAGVAVAFLLEMLYTKEE